MPSTGVHGRAGASRPRRPGNRSNFSPKRAPASTADSRRPGWLAAELTDAGAGQSLPAHRRRRVAPGHPVDRGRRCDPRLPNRVPDPAGRGVHLGSGAAGAAARVAAEEASAHGIDWIFAPMVDIARDPRWGRIAEGAGEDVFLGAALARARVRGFQAADLASGRRVAACPKHYVGLWRGRGRPRLQHGRSFGAQPARGTPAALQGRLRRRGGQRDELVQRDRRRAGHGATP